jgi:hypothetical protein
MLDHGDELEVEAPHGTGVEQGGIAVQCVGVVLPGRLRAREGGHEKGHLQAPAEAVAQARRW